jgi:hypothetical protein
VSNLNSTGRALVYSRFLGGNADDWGYGIAVDPAGCAYVTGETSSTDFPTTAGAFDTSFNGDWDAFVSKLNSTGSVLVYSTFVGGSSHDQGTRIAADASGGAYVTGYTESANFPKTGGAFDTSHNGGYGDAFVAKVVSLAPIPTPTESPVPPTETPTLPHTPTATAHPCAGCDANGDHAVNAIDLSGFSVSYGSTSGDVRYRAGFDGNRDGRIDPIDISYFSGCYGQSW